MKTNLEQIKTIIHKHSDLLRDTYNVNKIGVFGSITRNEQKETSDVDILVELSQPIGMFKFIELEEFLSKVIGRKVDLVTDKALKLAIKEDILQKVVYV